MAQMEERANSLAVADPFVAVEVDCERQTGADWYRLALAATFNGKAIHGLNATPSCETISKQSEAYAVKYATARIHFNPEERAIPAMGDDITERPYTYKDFKGIRSRPGTFFAFDQGLWEPSCRKRAREAALLAASIASHTGAKGDACKLVAKIAADEIDERAVDVANIPVSHMKRDIITVSKPSHRVFSCGTIQRAIRWEDNQLLAEKLPAVAAIDWGRITALARFIAEANIQMDSRFRDYARYRGVPYALVKGCWAYVAYGDFVLKSADFESIPEVDLSRYGIPTLAASYEFSADNMLRQCYLNLNKLAYEDESPDATQLLAILEACKMKVKGGVPKFRRWTDTEVLAGPSSHAIDSQEASRLVAASATSFNALADAAIVAMAALPDARRLGSLVATNSKMGRDDLTLVDKLTKTILINTTWRLATNTLAENLGNYTTAEIRMGRLKRGTFGFSGALSANFTITAAMARHARDTTISIARRALLSDPPELPKFNPFTDLRAMVGAHAMQKAAHSAIHSLDKFRAAWVERYKDWAAMFAENPRPTARPWAAKYAAAAIAFELIDASTITAITARFIDGANPTKSYLYLYAQAIAGYPIALNHATYATAITLAEELDSKTRPVTRYVDIESFVYSKLVWLAGDFGITQEAILRNEEAEAIEINSRSAPSKVVVSDVVVRLSREDLELEALFASELAKVDRTVSKVTFDSVLATYETETAADAFARANGFADFGEAYDTLKAGARFDPETEYAKKALAVIYEEAEEKDDGMILG